MILDVLHDKDKLGKELERIAWEVVMVHGTRPELRADAAQTLALEGFKAVQSYGEEVDKIIRHRMRSRLINFNRDNSLNERPVGLRPTGDQLLEEELEERAVAKLDAERTVASLFEADWLTDRQKEVLETLMEEDMDRSRTARRLGVNMQSVTNVLSRVRKKMDEHGFSQTN